MKKDEFVYMKIYNELCEKIESGNLKSGEKLPPENDMKDLYGVSRDTMRRALAKLESDGYIYRKAATGTFIRVQKTNYSLANHESFSEQMRAIGKQASSDILSIQISSEFEPEIVQNLEAQEGEKIYKICRLRKADDEPMAYEVAYIPQKLCPNLHTMMYENSSLYDLYENQYSLKMGNISVHIEAEAASGETQKILKIPNNAPILKVTSTMCLEDGRPLYYVVSKHIGGKYVFSTVLPRKR